MVDQRRLLPPPSFESWVSAQCSIGRQSDYLQAQPVDWLVAAKYMLPTLPPTNRRFDFASAVGKSDADQEILAQEQRNKVRTLWPRCACCGHAVHASELLCVVCGLCFVYYAPANA